MIKQISFKHGWFYHYRVHTKKTDELCSSSYPSLISYLDEMFASCPDKHFEAGPRSSSLKFELETDLQNNDEHQVCILAKQGLSIDQYKTAHTKVQVFMLNFDKNTIGVEVPIWITPEEFEGFSDLFNENKPLTGHIDVLRIEDGKIWIWDFKPNAKSEKYATTQTYFYALMLSKRTKIPLKNFVCGYFDEKNAFIFNPSDAKIAVPVASFNSG